MAAVTEKFSALKTASYFKERAKRANLEKALEILQRAGTEKLRKGDELPPARKKHKR